MRQDLPTRTVAVVGAGPVGLAAAAHLLERGFAPVVLEAAGTIAASFESFRHVQLFSPWRYNIDPAARRMLEAAGWKAPEPDFLPTAGAMIDRYLAPLSRLPAMQSAIRLSHRVLDVSREGYDKMKSKGRDEAPFVIRCETPDGVREVRAWAVLDASGNWGKPNPLGANGLPAIGEPRAAARILYGMPDILGRWRSRYAGKRVLVAGAGHSAAGNLLALAKLADEVPGTRIVWTLRGRNFARIFGGGENDGLAARGALGRRLKALAESGKLEIVADFRTREVRLGPGPSSASADARGDETESPRAPRSGEADSPRAPRSGDGPGPNHLTIVGNGPDGETRTIEAIDEIIVAAGGRPDLSLTSELRLKLDPWIESTESLAPLIDPNVHSCGTVRPHGHRELAHPEKRFYAIGSKSYGRAPNFLLATGHEQVRSVVAALAGDMAAADDVQLDLPQTGVCSTQFDEASSGCCSPSVAPEPSGAQSSCASTGCGGASKQREDACCGLDERIKDAGGSGCGSEASKAATDRARSAACCR